MIKSGPGITSNSPQSHQTLRLDPALSGLERNLLPGEYHPGPRGASMDWFDSTAFQNAMRADDEKHGDRIHEIQAIQKGNPKLYKDVLRFRSGHRITIGWPRSSKE